MSAASTPRHRPAPLAENELARLEALGAHAILDTPPDRAFDQIVSFTSAICAAPIAAVSLIDAQRQWFKASVGLGIVETPREVSFCAHTILQDGLFLIADTHSDERFADNPLVTGSPAIRFYAGAPVKAEDGAPLGALCVIDTVPRTLTPLQRQALVTLGHQVEAQLRLRLALREVETKNELLQRVSLQKAELSALMVHDLKGPLSAILANATYLLEETPPRPVDARRAALDIETSARTMHRRVMDVLDISSAEQGELRTRLRDVDLSGLLDHIARSAFRRAAAQRRDLHLDLDLQQPVIHSDADLLMRVFENLMDNALKYSPPGSPLWLSVERTRGGEVLAKLRDEGTTLPEAQRERIFEKYVRLDGGDAQTHTSRGIGLAFCRLAVEQLGGRIWVEPNGEKGNSFCVSLPLQLPL